MYKSDFQASCTIWPEIQTFWGLPSYPQVSVQVFLNIGFNNSATALNHLSAAQSSHFNIFINFFSSTDQTLFWHQTGTFLLFYLELCSAEYRFDAFIRAAQSADFSLKPKGYLFRKVRAFTLLFTVLYNFTGIFDCLIFNLTNFACFVLIEPVVSQNVQLVCYDFWFLKSLYFSKINLDTCTTVFPPIEIHWGFLIFPLKSASIYLLYLFFILLSNFIFCTPTCS